MEGDGNCLGCGVGFDTPLRFSIFEKDSMIKKCFAYKIFQITKAELIFDDESFLCNKCYDLLVQIHFLEQKFVDAFSKNGQQPVVAEEDSGVGNVEEFPEDSFNNSLIDRSPEKTFIDYPKPEKKSKTKKAIENPNAEIPYEMMVKIAEYAIEKYDQAVKNGPENISRKEPSQPKFLEQLVKNKTEEEYQNLPLKKNLIIPSKAKTPYNTRSKTNEKMLNYVDSLKRKSPGLLITKNKAAKISTSSDGPRKDKKDPDINNTTVIPVIMEDKTETVSQIIEKEIRKEMEVEVIDDEMSEITEKVSPQSLNGQILFDFMGNASYKCEVCPKTFEKLDLLQKHRKMHTGGVDFFKCKFCSKLFTEPKKLKEHFRTAHKEEYEKQQETLGIMNFNQTNKNNDQQSSNFNEKPYKCGLCKLSFEHAITLNIHKKVHETKMTMFHCKTCNKAFNSHANLEFHMIYKHAFNNQGQQSQNQAHVIRNPDYQESMMNNNFPGIMTSEGKTFTEVEQSLDQGKEIQIIQNRLAEIPGTIMKNADKRFQCTECPMSFDYEITLRVHSKNHVKSE